jgi:pimeloyl-ACP methyl ester carboxylesterase
MSDLSAARLRSSVPVVLLVHGVFSDTSSWSDVIATLSDAGVEAVAPALPLRGLSSDARYLADVAGRHAGPVLLVGTCYSGAVITVAGALADNAAGLVYVAGFAPAEGESCVDVARAHPRTALADALRPATFHTPHGEPAIELSIDASAFRDVYAADLAPRRAALMAAAQRPVAAAALEEKASVAAWHSLPSWYLVATADRAVHPDAQRAMARRAGSVTIEVDASHSVAVSQAAAVAALVESAARAT